MWLVTVCVLGYAVAGRRHVHTAFRELEPEPQDTAVVGPCAAVATSLEISPPPIGTFIHLYSRPPILGESQWYSIDLYWVGERLILSKFCLAGLNMLPKNPDAYSSGAAKLFLSYVHAQKNLGAAMGTAASSTDPDRQIHDVEKHVSFFPGGVPREIVTLSIFRTPERSEQIIEFLSGLKDMSFLSTGVKALDSVRFTYVILSDRINIARTAASKVADYTSKHAELANMLPVWCAGEMRIINREQWRNWEGDGAIPVKQTRAIEAIEAFDDVRTGPLLVIDNNSGTYRPTLNSLRVARDVFESVIFTSKELLKWKSKSETVAEYQIQMPVTYVESPDSFKKDGAVASLYGLARYISVFGGVTGVPSPKEFFTTRAPEDRLPILERMWAFCNIREMTFEAFETEYYKAASWKPCCVPTAE